MLVSSIVGIRECVPKRFARASKARDYLLRKGSDRLGLRLLLRVNRVVLTALMTPFSDRRRVSKAKTGSDKPYSITSSAQDRRSRQAQGMCADIRQKQSWIFFDRPLTTNCCAPKQAPGPSLQEPSKAGPGPSSGGDAFSALAMPPGPLPERCDRTTPMPLASQP